MDPYHYFPGTLPVVVSVPHVGTYVPESILERFEPPAKQLRDTDWYVDKLYDFARQIGVHMLVATYSRYVIDLNRSPDGHSLYPGQFTTGLCPTTLFDASPIYKAGLEPDAQEIQQRTQDYWKPYHNKLKLLMHTLRDGSQRVALFDAHSIASHVPTLFEGRLPDLNLGTADGTSANDEVTQMLLSIAQESSYSTVVNGRFKGGYITRHYGMPEHGIHAVQLELAQINYMDENAPFAYDEKKAQTLQATLRPMIEALANWAS